MKFYRKARLDDFPYAIEKMLGDELSNKGVYLSDEHKDYVLSRIKDNNLEEAVKFLNEKFAMSKINAKHFVEDVANILNAQVDYDLYGDVYVEYHTKRR